MDLNALLAGDWDLADARAVVLEETRNHPQEWVPIIGAAPTRQLGSGRYGDTFDLPGPWVVKITTDSHEVDLWEVIQHLPVVRRRGLAEVREIGHLGRETLGLSFLVRERVELLLHSAVVVHTPPFGETGPMAGYAENRRSRYLSTYSERLIGTKVPVNPLFGRVAAKGKRTTDLFASLNAIFLYQCASRALHTLWEIDHQVPVEQRVTQDFELHSIASSLGDDPAAWSDLRFVKQQLEESLRNLSEIRYTVHLADSLDALWRIGIALNDVRDANLGWRYQPRTPELKSGLRANEAPYLVLFDPGFTPRSHEFSPTRRPR